MTAAKKEIIDLNKDSVCKFVEHLQSYTSYKDAHLSLIESDKDLDLFKINETESYTSTDSMYKLYLGWIRVFNERGQFNKQNFSKKLAVYSVKPEVKKIDKKSIRVYNVNNIEILMSALDEVEEE